MQPDLILSADKRNEARARLRRMLPPVLTFTAGALAGALGYIQLGFWCLGLPLLAIMTAWSLLRRSAPQSA